MVLIILMLIWFGNRCAQLIYTRSEIVNDRIRIATNGKKLEFGVLTRLR